jgi:hypothetical protein
VRRDISDIHLVDEVLVVGIKLERLAPKILHLLVTMIPYILEALEVLDEIPNVTNKPIFSSIDITANFTVVARKRGGEKETESRAHDEMPEAE